MSGRGSLIKTIVALFIWTPFTAFAGKGDWSNRCEAEGKKATQACQGYSNTAKAADIGQSNSQQKALGTGGLVNNGASAVVKQAQDQAGRLTDAQNKCKTEEEKCKSACDKEEQDRKSKLALPDTPSKPPIKVKAEQDTEVENTKQSACILPIVAIMGDLGKGAAAANQAAADAGKTGGASNSTPPIPPISPSQGGQEEGKKDSNPVAEKLNCEAEGNSRYSDCNSHYIEKCQNAMTTTGCDGFINRYCGSYNPPANDTITATPVGNDSLSLSAQSSTKQSAAVTANLVADKQGEGMGSAFCKKATAFKFCQMAGRSECPSCKNLNSPWSMDGSVAAATEAQKTCPTDPMFLDAAVQQQLANPTAATTNASGTVTTQSTKDRLSPGSNAAVSGGSGAMNTQTAGAIGTGSSVLERTYSGPSLANGSGYGGGAGGSYEGQATGPGYEPASVNGDAQRAPASSLAVQGGPRDVAIKYGPSVFSIQSTTYRDLCARGRFLHCRR